MTQNDGSSEQPEQLDPFDPVRLRASALEDIGVEKVLLTVPVRKPLRTEFFRVHPDPAFSLDWAVIERNEEQDREIFWVTEKFRGELVDELKPHRLFVSLQAWGGLHLARQTAVGR